MCLTHLISLASTKKQLFHLVWPYYEEFPVLVRWQKFTSTSHMEPEK